MKGKRVHKSNLIHTKIVFPILTIIGAGFFFTLSSFYEKSWTYNWVGIRESIKDSIKEAEYLGISSGVVGPAARTPKQFFRRHWIMKNAKEDELLKLTEYPNGTIKTIAYEGLIRNKAFKSKKDLILTVISDTEYPIHFQTGCEGITMNISEYLIDYVLFIDLESPPPPERLKNQFELTKEEIEEILFEYRKIPSLWKK